jgi:membrane protein
MHKGNRHVVQQPPSPDTSDQSPVWLQKLGWPVLKRSVQAFFNDDGSALAAATAYYAAFSFFPVLLVLLSGVGFVLQASTLAQDKQQLIIDQIAQSTNQALANQISTILSAVETQAPIGGPLGLFTLLLAAIACFAQIDSAFDRIFHTPTAQHGGLLSMLHRVLFDRAKSFLMLLSLGLLIGASFIVGMVLSTLSHVIEDFPFAHFGWQVIRGLATLTLNATVFMTLYKVLPRVSVRWTHAAIGGLLTAIIWEIGRVLLGWFVIGSKYSAYGVVGSFIAMMVWVYYASTVLFLGAEVVKVLGEQRPAIEKKASRKRGK